MEIPEDLTSQKRSHLYVVLLLIRLFKSEKYRTPTVFDIEIEMWSTGSKSGGQTGFKMEWMM